MFPATAPEPLRHLLFRDWLRSYERIFTASPTEHPEPIAGFKGRCEEFPGGS